jgi:hypothetical protein
MLVISCRRLRTRASLERHQCDEVTSDNERGIGVCLLVTSGKVMSSAHDWWRRAIRSSPHNIARAIVIQAAIMLKIVMARLINSSTPLSSSCSPSR